MLCLSEVLFGDYLLSPVWMIWGISSGLGLKWSVMAYSLFDEDVIVWGLCIIMRCYDVCELSCGNEWMQFS